MTIGLPSDIGRPSTIGRPSDIDRPLTIGRPSDIDRPSDIGRPPQIILSEYGEIVDKAIQNINIIYEPVKVDKYVIMPNHIHMILLIESGHTCLKESGRPMAAPTTVSTVINQFKGYVSKQIGFSLWQKLFHDHIIRNDKDYQNHWQYIEDNPTRWFEDDYYAQNEN